MHYDAIIIGAGMSGLAAGIRLAHFDRRVLIVERHYAFGGLNSYYTLDGREFDVGLHAVTNFVPPGVRSTPLPKLLRQLRLSRDDFDLCEQKHSEIRFPGCGLRFTNDPNVLTQQICERFPKDADSYRRLLETIEQFDDLRLDRPYRSARRVLGESLCEPALIEMLLCPVMYYGSAEERDMDFAQFVTIFKSILREGFARPRGGVRTIIKTLVKKYRACGGKIRMNCGVESIEVVGDRAKALTLQSGETLTADTVISSAGYHETMRMCHGMRKVTDPGEVGRVSFVETICVLDTPPAQLGHGAAVVFYNDSEAFHYQRPANPVDTRSGVVCCPTNYQGHEDEKEGLFRVTWLANPEPWMSCSDESYRDMKGSCYDKVLELGETYMPGFRDRVIAHDLFTPRTIEHFTGHINGAVYGTPVKRRDGCTELENLFICGTDQGFLGIIGAMLSGITIANLHVLSKT